MNVGKRHGIQAVLFDVYGTLLSSSAGEIHPDIELRHAIAAVHANSPHPYPEVDIREIHAAFHPGISRQEIEDLALTHENSVNPVTPMPGAVATLQALHSHGIKIGLISNAQFYTVPILEESLGHPLGSLGIDPELCVFSYRYRRAKPDPFLFSIAADLLRGRGILPSETMIIGNDVRNDTDPAKAAGFRTALFAGDPRSLRLHGRPLADSGADLVITEMHTLPGWIGH